MSHTLTRAGLRLGAALTAVGLVAGGLLVSSAGTATAGSTVTLDHFLCYQARVAAPQVPRGIQLANIIQPKPFMPVIGPATTHCNPANKSVPRALFKALNPLAHLLCWNLKFALGPATVLVTNQFGKAVMRTGAPNKLCLPSWKDNITYPGAGPGVAPPGLDHFTCYPLVALAASYGFHPPAFVKVEDEFSAPRYIPLKLARANQLCVPTVKILPTGFSYPPQGPNDPNLVCFPTSPTPIWKTVFDSNQFGNETVYPNTTHEEFCLPSTLSLQSPPPGG
jgi:hypothetical protein